MLPRAPGGWTGTGILALVLATAAVAGWAVSWWIVPPYVALMAWLLLPAENRDRPESSSAAGPVPPAPTIPVGSLPAVEPESVAEASTSPPTRPARARKPRTRSKPKDKEPPPVAPEPMLVNWVQVAPGKFVRVESPPASTIEGPAAPEDDEGRPPDPPPDDGIDLGDEPVGFDPPMRPDEVEPEGPIPNEAPDPDDPGQGDYSEPDPDSGPGSPEGPQDEHPGYAESREPGGEDAAITPTEPVGVSQAEPGPAVEETPPEGPSTRPSDEKTEVAGIAPDASAKPSERAPARPVAPTASPLRVDGWPGRLLDDRAGRTRGPIVGIPPLPTPRLDRGRNRDPGRHHGRPRHDRPFHQDPPRKQPSRGPPR